MNRLILLSIFFLLTSLAFSENGISRPTQYPGVYRPLYTEFPQGSPLTSFRADIIDKNRISFTKDTLIIDFEKKQVTYANYDTLTGAGLWKFHYAELEDYLRAMEKHTRYNLWRDIVYEKGRVSLKSKKSGQLLFALPATMPAWAKRIMGNKPPQLLITGSQSIKLGAKWTRDGTKDDPSNVVKGTEPIFTPRSNFSIKGSIGRLLRMEIKLSGDVTKDDFLKQAGDELSQIKIHYKADSTGELEDQIIQEVIIGKTNFSMEGVGLIGYPGSNDGLFGIKVRSKFGPLDVTAIASIEQVETQHKTITTGESAQQDTIGEDSYVKNRFFFLDSSYVTAFEGNDLSKMSPPVQVRLFKLITSGKIDPTDRLANFKKEGNTRPGNFRELIEGTDFEVDVMHGWVRLNSQLSDNDLLGMYLRMQDGTTRGDVSLVDITYDTTTKAGYKDLWVLKLPSDETHLGDSTYSLMMRNVYSIGTSDIPSFKFALERRMRDGALSAIEEKSGKQFDVLMGLADSSGNVYSQNQNIFDLNNGFLIMPPFPKSATPDSLENSIFPFTNPILGTSNSESNINYTIYDNRKSNVINKFAIITTSVKKTNNYSIDFGVVEGSEKLKVNGIQLVKNVDYTIDYGFGQIELISAKAQSADKIEVDYQKESLFMLDNKVFLGLSARLDMPGVGRNSYLSTTALWQLMNSKNMTPKVGTEPYNRFAWGTNLTLDFEPYWMTALVDKIPLINTEAPSTARFEFEVAKSKVTSNIKKGRDGNNNKVTRDSYIDNFSTSARTYGLGTSERSWYRAAPDRNWVEEIAIDTIIDNSITPPDTTFDTLETGGLQSHPPAWQSYWVQPAGDTAAGRSLKKEIYDPANAQTTKEANSYMSTLRLYVKPLPDDSSLAANVKDANDSILVKPWAGITRGLTGSLVDHEKDRYFEFWVRQNSYRGKIYIDFGEISEDVVLNGMAPNGYLDRETDNNTVSAATDLGLDRKTDTTEVWNYPHFDDNGNFVEWTELKYGDDRLGKFVNDPAKDNWKRYDNQGDNIKNIEYANGTDKNIDIMKVADVEDINKDGSFFRVENDRYFRYVLDLSKSGIENSPYFDSLSRPTHDGGDLKWYHIRLPIGKIADSLISTGVFDTITSSSGAKPSWNLIRHVRFLWSDIEGAKNLLDSLELVDMQFVGNQWKQADTLFEDHGNDTISYDSLGTIVATILDSKNTLNYSRPSQKIKDSVGTSEATDYTLRLEYKDILPNATVMSAKELSTYQKLDLTRYRELKFWANDTTELGRNIDYDKDNWLVFRFGSSDSSYYEFKTKRISVGPTNIGWDGEGFSINLDSITKLKLAWFNKYGERNQDGIDTTLATLDGDSISIFSAGRNVPTLSAVTWLAYGIENRSGDNLKGEIWINGLRVSGISDYEGWAMEGNLSLEWADFIKMGGRYGYRDAHFRSMSQDISSPTDASMNATFNGEISLDKLFPKKLGISLPVGGDVRSSLSRPEVRENSDIRLADENGRPDGFSDMAREFSRIITGADNSVATTEASKYQKENLSKGIYVKYQKNRDSKHVITNLLADRISANYNYKSTDSLARKGEVPENEQGLASRNIGKYHISTLKSKKHDFNLEYDLKPGRKTEKALSFQPFKKSKSRMWSSKVKRVKFNLLPSTADFKLINVNYGRSDRYNSIDDILRDTAAADINTVNENLGIRHSFDFAYKPIDPFTSFNYAIDIDRNYDQYLKTWGHQGMGDFMNYSLFKLNPAFSDYGMLFNEQKRGQSMTIKVNPDIFKWLSVSSSLKGNYSQNLGKSGDTSFITSSTVGSIFDFQTTFRVRRLFEIMGKAGDGKTHFANINKAISKGFDVVDLENFSFNYNANMILNNMNMESAYVNNGLHNDWTRYTAYSFGLSGRSFHDIITGNMNDNRSFGGVQNRNSWYKNGEKYNLNDKRVTTQNYSVSTSFKLPDPIDFSVSRISLGWRRSYNITPIVNRFDTSVTWPEVRLSGNSSILEKISSVKQTFSRLNLETGYTYKNTTRRSASYFLDRDTNSLVNKSVTITHGFDPLVKITGTLRKKRIDMSYGLSLLFDSTQNGDETFSSPSAPLKFKATKADEVVTLSHTVTGGYKVKGRKGKTLKLFKDQVIEILGDMKYNLTFGLKTMKYKQTADNTRDEDLANHDDYMINLRPEYLYDITKDITLKVYYDLIHSVLGIEKREHHSAEIAGELTISF